MIYAKCIKETYTCENDWKQHRFHKVVKGHIYGFNNFRDSYWIVPEAASTEDFMDLSGYIDCVGCRLEKKYFDEMFEIV